MNKLSISGTSYGSFRRRLSRDIAAIRGCHFMNFLIGKFRRYYLVRFRKKYVQRQLGSRKGECLQCGVCCALLFTCPMLTDQRLCRIYGPSRWKVCKVFPIDQKDINEVTLMGGKCGYHF